MNNTSIKIRELSVSYSLKNNQSINALKDISFDLSAGDQVGVIGTNGSGKSTLLKILSSILPASSGELEISGEVLSLLDRTSGLIRKATLNENARLKAYSLGLSGDQIQPFISTCLQQAGLKNRANFPMSSLSTGMVAKFNLAINSQVFKPITILDEWVGTLDTAQTGGESIMGKLSKSADILLLASHNEPLIRELCNKVILLNEGKVDYFGRDLDHAFKVLNEVKLQASPSTGHLNAALENDKKQRVHILRIPKSGGYLLNKILSKTSSDRYELIVHSVNTKLKDIPTGEKVIFFVRNPIERFVRAFYMRYNQGFPFYNSQWTTSEKNIFKKFNSANQLAEALSDNGSSIQSEAILSLSKVGHLTTQISDYLGEQDELIIRQKDIMFIGNADELITELDRLKSTLELNTDVILNNIETKHFTSVFSDQISEKAKINLQSLYQKDINYFKHLTKK